MCDKLALLSARLQEEQSTMSRNRRHMRVSKVRRTPPSAKVSNMPPSKLVVVSFPAINSRMAM